ncbi:MAG: rhomboid family intramembrane serine protease [Candidatus Riflebacteria bacterium]|nr:rhomboid family intramembrane serine protease [Candidatus Riflebacteria bacterium]
MKSYRTTLLICVFILVGWIASAHFNNLKLFETQNSKLILKFGAINGESMERGQYWKLITSQFLHQKFPHMLFNIALIFYLGSIFETLFGSRVFLITYFVTGIVGQIASVLSYPMEASSGASQALCGIVGAYITLLLFPRLCRKTVICTIFVFLAIQAFLDVYFAGYLKSGHSIGFLSGFFLGIILRFFFLQKELVILNSETMK